MQKSAVKVDKDASAVITVLQALCFRFPEFFNMLTPKVTAAAIVSAQRRNLRETTVPTYMLHLNNSVRAMPRRAAEIFIDFIDSGLEPHD